MRLRDQVMASELVKLKGALRQLRSRFSELSKHVIFLEFLSICLLASDACTFVKPKEWLPRVAVQVRVGSGANIIPGAFNCLSSDEAS